MYMPAVAGLVGLSWTIGADLQVPALDERYIESLRQVEKVYRIWYSDLSFEGTINVGRVERNSWDAERSGCLFSGGLDSTYTFVENMAEKPLLITIFGSEIPIDQLDYIDMVRGLNSRFAAEAGTDIEFIETDLLQRINTGLLNYETRRFFHYILWWEAVSIGLTFTGLTAPLTHKLRLGTIRTSSSFEADYNEPYGVHYLVDPYIRWADVQVSHHGHNVNRVEKIRYIKQNYIDALSLYPTFRVCNVTPQIGEGLNCGLCEKCRRMVTGLVLEGVDPAACGFSIPVDFFNDTRELLVDGFLEADSRDIIYWENIQNSIDSGGSYQLYDSEEFFKWFKTYDLSQHRVDSSLDKKMKNLLMLVASSLPHGLRRRLRVLYNRRSIS